MPKRLFLIFNHETTQEQRLDAENSLGVSDCVDLPAQLKEIWRQIPAELESVKEHLLPISDWLSQNGKSGDYVLIQGDFGGVYYLVNLAFELGIVPLYSTTERKAVEIKGKDGEIHLSHIFRHVRFRKYMLN
ncbi:MAG: hypothetical protein HQK64_06805 [Desulfamplus sp.]|nr:hypothetical protein [Desulfamplus sp.]